MACANWLLQRFGRLQPYANTTARQRNASPARTEHTSRDRSRTRNSGASCHPPRPRWSNRASFRRSAGQSRSAPTRKNSFGKIEVHDREFGCSLAIGCSELAPHKHRLLQNAEIAGRDLFILEARFFVFAESMTLNLKVDHPGIPGQLRVAGPGNVDTPATRHTASIALFTVSGARSPL